MTVLVWVHLWRRSAEGHLFPVSQQFLCSVQEAGESFLTTCLDLSFKDRLAAVILRVCAVVQWESQHAGLTCEQYQTWKRENDPEYQKQGLAGYLRDNGISEFIFTVSSVQNPRLTVSCRPVCPSDVQLVRTAVSSTRCLKAAACTSAALSVGTSSAAAVTTLFIRYDLSDPEPFQVSGAMWCLSSFPSFPQTCAVDECSVSGLHAHHPRDCLFYLRDWEPARLQALLQVCSLRRHTKD